ncbi:MAG: F0F1 ATP synthase subunit epsilon [Muribaculaceae bacterium]|nr:F0F1 ATP synthase subunit epsilon [Muribaculaceae bacterium]
MKLEIISAHEISFTGDVTSVTLPGKLGSFTVLKDHAPIISVLVKGLVKYTAVDGSQHELEIGGGLADVNSNVISVCVY